ncbi:MAG TPA: XrtB/PEP-CTERM-associated transcriptional regulator EpsA [Ramlibacter sp.]|nr:XrtB/PEP-CTERM-associated transcriptional regulator EpsA [Ramlibacter sp.]
MPGFASQEASIALHADALLSLVQEALAARSQIGWSRWLQGEIQRFLPHDAVIAAWGDFRAGVLAYDVITAGPALSVHALPRNVIEPLMVSLFEKWQASDEQPVALEAKELRMGPHHLALGSPWALVHGLKDHRGRYDCVYLFVGPIGLASASARQLCRIMLPIIDNGFRQLDGRGQKHPPEQPADGDAFSNSSFADCPFNDTPLQGSYVDSVFDESCWTDRGAGERGAALSARELEIMQWVRMGKTNSEIAMILNLSTFTVKNHMRRIYRKLDVLNRAQAVGNLDRMQGVQHAAR